MTDQTNQLATAWRRVARKYERMVSKWADPDNMSDEELSEYRSELQSADEAMVYAESLEER